MRSLMIAAALHVGVLALASTPGSAAEPMPVSDPAVGRFVACDDKGFCEDVEQNFTSIAGCQVRMIPYMAQWIGDHEKFHLKSPQFTCRPIEQVRI